VWKNFRHTFTSLVDLRYTTSNNAMSNTLKFHYLKSSITGNAALLINRFKISPKNYTAAWKILVMEYDDKRALIHYSAGLCKPNDNAPIRCFGQNYTSCARTKVLLRLASCKKSGPIFPLTAYVFQHPMQPHKFGPLNRGPTYAILSWRIRQVSNRSIC
jgi:hypothetical protein